MNVQIKKNIPLIVKSISYSSENTFLSIKDAIMYYETQGIKLNRKTLYINIKKGIVYKGLIFRYNKREINLDKR